MNSIAQSGYNVLFDRLGLHLYYKYDFYNTIKINSDLYDQYKITGYAEYEGDNPIFTPIHLGFTFNKHMQGIIEKYYKSYMNGDEPNYIPYYNLMKKMPNSRPGIEFSSISKGQQTHNFWVPGSLSAITKYDTLSIPNSINKILLKGYKSSCFIYILVNKGEEVPIPEWTVHDYNYTFVYVQPYMKKNNWKEGPSTFDDCLNGTPIGNEGDKPPMENAKEAVKHDNHNPNPSPPDTQRETPSLENLKAALIAHLSQNCHNKTFSYNDATNSVTDYKFHIENDYLIISYLIKRSYNPTYGDNSYTTTPCTITHSVKLGTYGSPSKYSISKDFGGDYLTFNIDEIWGSEHYVKYTKTGKVETISKRQVGANRSLFIGYDFGYNDNNLKELKKIMNNIYEQSRK